MPLSYRKVAVNSAAKLIFCSRNGSILLDLIGGGLNVTYDHDHLCHWYQSLSGMEKIEGKSHSRSRCRVVRGPEWRSG
jgi:hypothetical protein